MKQAMLTYKRKLILNKAQQQRIDSWIGACRVVYNLCLEIQQAAHRNKQTFIHKYELQLQLKDIRSEYSWMEDVPSNALVDVTNRLEFSYKRFFKGAGYPKWASKRKYNSITFRAFLAAKDNKIRVNKIGWLKMFKDAPVQGKIKIITIKKEVTGYFACITCDEVSKSIQNSDENQVIGLDMGLSHFCVDSNGGFISNPRHFKKYERQLRIENRALARKKKGSNNWKKQAKRVSLLHHKIGNVRKDFLHKESTRIAKQFHTVIIEDLNVSGMSKSNFGKHILDAGWGAFRRMLEYKTEVIAVNAKHTSQRCSNCGYIDSENRKSQSEFICKSCGHEANADHNAALNILGRGTAYLTKRKATV